MTVKDHYFYLTFLESDIYYIEGAKGFDRGIAARIACRGSLDLVKTKRLILDEAFVARAA